MDWTLLTAAFAWIVLGVVIVRGRGDSWLIMLTDKRNVRNTWTALPALLLTWIFWPVKETPGLLFKLVLCLESDEEDRTMCLKLLGAFFAVLLVGIVVMYYVSGFVFHFFGVNIGR